MLTKRFKMIRAFYVVVAFVMTCGLLIFNTNGVEQYQLVVGGVAPVKIKSPTQTVNEYQTELHREEAIKNTPSVYLTDADITDGILTSLEEFFVKVEDKRRAYSFMVDYNSMLQEGEEPRTFIFDGILEGYQASEIETLVTMSDEDYEVFKGAVTTVLSSTLTDGVKVDEMPKASILVKDALSTKMDSKYLDLGYKVALDFLEPNTFVDYESTNAAIEVSKNNVKPVIVQEGQTIVDEGEIITLPTYNLLDQLGFIADEEKGMDGTVVMAYVSLTVILFAMLVGFIFKNNIKALLRFNLMSAYFTIYVLGILLIAAVGETPYTPAICILYSFWIAVLIDSKLAYITNVIFAILCITLADFQLIRVVYIIITGTFMVSFSQYVADRSRILTATFIMCLFNLLLFLTLSYFYNLNILTQTAIEGDYLSVVFIPMVSTVAVILVGYGSMPIWEGVFGILTPTTLTELTKPTKPLLRRLTIEAPGTYHHSLIVANLAEEAAVKIGANPHITRVASYYHDIGKLSKPSYFAENQDGVSLHKTLSPQESTEIIKSHITEGIALAKRYKLPKQIIDVAYQHHGNTLVKYFYIKAYELDENINEEDFRYIGDKPKTKEAGIIMLADSVEAAVRSVIKNVTSKEDLEAFIDKLINDKILDGQLDECELTYHEVKQIKETFMNVFKGMYHERVVYPDKIIEKEVDIQEKLGDKPYEEKMSISEDTCKDSKCDEDTKENSEEKS